MNKFSRLLSITILFSTTFGWCSEEDDYLAKMRQQRRIRIALAEQAKKEEIDKEIDKINLMEKQHNEVAERKRQAIKASNAAFMARRDIIMLTREQQRSLGQPQIARPEPPKKPWWHISCNPCCWKQPKEDTNPNNVKNEPFLPQ